MTLLPEHLAYLQARGIGSEMAIRFYEADQGDLVIPYRDPSGQPYKQQPGRSELFVVRRHFPTSTPKFKAPWGAGNRPYFSPLMPAGALYDVTIPLVLIEGPFKVDACWIAIPNGYCFVGLTGTWNIVDRRDEAGQWSEDNETRVLPELKAIPMTGRLIIILFDSDIADNKSVASAAKFIANWTRCRGGCPHRVRLPHEPNGNKNGADDFIVRYGPQALVSRLEEAQVIGYPIPAPLLADDGELRGDYDSTEELELIEALAKVTDMHVLDVITRKLTRKLHRKQSELLAQIEDARTGESDRGFLASDEELAGIDIDSRWIVPDFIPRGEVVILTADPGVGKSLLAYDLCLAIATGGEFLGFKVPKGRVLILQLEEGGSFGARLRALGFHDLAKRGDDWEASRSFDLAKPSHMQQLRGMLRKGWDFVMIDPLRALARSFDVEETSAEFGRKIVRPLAKTITDAGAAGLLIHHNAAGTGKAAGTRDIPAAVWGVFNLKRVVDGDDENLHLSSDKTRDSDPLLWHLRKMRCEGFDGSEGGCTWELVNMLQHMAPDLPLLKRVDALLDMQTQPITLRQIAEGLGLPEGDDGKVNPTLRAMASKAAALRQWSDKAKPVARYWKPLERRRQSVLDGMGVSPSSDTNQLTHQSLQLISRIDEGCIGVDLQPKSVDAPVGRPLGDNPEIPLPDKGVNQSPLVCGITPSSPSAVVAEPFGVGESVQFLDRTLGEWRDGYTVLASPDPEGRVHLKSPTGATFHTRQRNVRRSPSLTEMDDAHIQSAAESLGTHLATTFDITHGHQRAA
jgi:hypothetical protein